MADSAYIALFIQASSLVLLSLCILLFKSFFVCSCYIALFKPNNDKKKPHDDDDILSFTTCILLLLTVVHIIINVLYEQKGTISIRIMYSIRKINRSSSHHISFTSRLNSKSHLKLSALTLRARIVCLSESLFLKGRLENYHKIAIYTPSEWMGILSALWFSSHHHTVMIMGIKKWNFREKRHIIIFFHLYGKSSHLLYNAY